ncbi:MAG TPA: DEAD/DEAH box helicase family protein [Gaiellaceae bacterium]|nr:DEAD/DEAH box helicase family protein [Gaiellaceae bacterium]
MQKTIDQPTRASDEANGLEAAALRAGAWAGEPFLHEDEDPREVLAPGTARRRALDEALEEMAAGAERPSPEWKVRFALMLGLERVLSEKPPHLASGTELRRHQIDALAGMLTELIAANQRQQENGNGPNGYADQVAAVADEEEDDDELDGELDEIEEATASDPGAARRYRFRHPTASGKTIAAAGFVEAARSIGVLILTHRRLLVNQFRRELTAEGYGARLVPEIVDSRPAIDNPITIQTYAWFARHVGDLRRDAYQLVICDEAHTALGEKTSAAIRSFPEPIYVGMTATEQLIAKQVADVFPASVDDLPLQDAARRGLIASLRCLRVPPVAAINSVPIVGGDFDQHALARVLDHQALNQAAASLYRDRFDDTPGIVYAAGVDHAYHLAQEFRAVGLKAEAVSGRTPPVKLAETLAAYERGEINVLINAMLLAEGWNSPRATVVMHLAPTASRRVYQQRIGRIMRIHPRKEAGIVVDFVNKGATHSDRVVTLHSLLDADFYREGARVIPTPRRRMQRRARRKLTPAPWLVPVTPDVKRRLGVIAREWQRIDPRYLDEDEQRYWATFAGRNLRFEEREAFVQKFTDGRASKAALETFLFTCAAENPNRRLRMMALADRVSMRVDRASFDDLVTLVTQAPTWEKDRQPGVRVLLQAIGDGKPDAPEQILVRWTWRLARATRKALDRKASAEYPEAKRLLGALANSRGHRHEENAAKLVVAVRELPLPVAAALLASADGYTPRATKLLESAREELGTPAEIAAALAGDLPEPKPPRRSRRRRRRKKRGDAEAAGQAAPEETAADAGDEPSAQGPAEVDTSATDGGEPPTENEPDAERSEQGGSTE